MVPLLTHKNLTLTQRRRKILIWGLVFLNVKETPAMWCCAYSTKQIHVWLMFLAAPHGLHGDILARPNVPWWYYCHSAGQLLFLSTPKTKGLELWDTVWVSLIQKDKPLHHPSCFGIEWSSMGHSLSSTFTYLMYCIFKWGWIISFQGIKNEEKKEIFS